MAELSNRRSGGRAGGPALLGAAAAALAAPSGTADASGYGVKAAIRCPVSSPTARPLPQRPSFNFGTPRIAVDLPPRATFVAVPEGQPGGAWVQRDGSIRTKLGWWRARGTLRVTGRRLGSPTRRLRADVGVVSWTAAGEFIPSLLFFPSTGCWRISATAGGARLVVVVRVIKR